MAVYFPVPATPNGRYDTHHNPQWPSPSSHNGLVTYQQHLQHPAYHSPGSITQQPPLRPQSTTPQQPIPHHWQQQIIKYEASRGAAAPHHRARTSAFTMRSTTKSAIPITNPNMHKTTGSISDRTDGSGDEVPRQGTPSGNGHPSSIVGPVTASPPMAQRPTVRPPAEAMWTTLDMGGMRLKNLSPSLFKLANLTTLYLNHNNLTSLSPHISQLRNLIHLDLSANQLTSLPPEVGMLTSLKELLVFDNLLETLPPQLGTLHQLVMLGLEGNPMQQTYRTILQKDGTQQLITYLRDSCPVPSPPPERLWKTVPPRNAESELDTETFTLLCYNILCERYATSSMYGYTPSWALAWDYRKELIITEIVNYEADFLCLQEVDAAQYEEYFMPHLERHGYDGIFSPKSRARTMPESQRRHVDGCATFYKKDKYVLVEHQLIEFNSATHHTSHDDYKMHNLSDDMYNRVFTKDNIAIIALLENRSTGSRLIIANVHVHWDPEFRDVKLVQVAIMMGELEKISRGFARLPPRLLDGSHGPIGVNGHSNGVNGHSNGTSSSSSSPEPLEPQPVKKAPTYDDGSKIPTIVCGDFNSIPASGVYEYLLNGHLAPDHDDFMAHKYGKWTDVISAEGGMRHNFSLKSAYATALGGQELPITNYTPSFKGVIDYIWYTNLSLSVEAVLGEVDEKYLEKVVGFPNAHFPSDHVCIISEFRVLKPKEAKENNGPTKQVTAFTNGRSRK